MAKKWGKYPVALCMRVSVDMDAAMQACAARTDQSMTTLVRNALEHYLRQNGNAETSSAELEPIGMVGDQPRKITCGVAFSPSQLVYAATDQGIYVHPHDGTMQ